VHRITKASDSPLLGETRDSLIKAKAELILYISGIDSVSGDQVTKIDSLRIQDVHFGFDYMDFVKYAAADKTKLSGSSMTDHKSGSSAAFGAHGSKKSEKQKQGEKPVITFE
jgi:hypothetical protein